jgi:endonuclease/exonuclease/phosphatase family metal-dependent hydrolase
VISIAYNVFGFDGYQHPHGEKRGWPAGKPPVAHARAVGRGLIPYLPDIITISESRHEQSVEELAGALDFNFAYFPSPGQWPGAVLTRYRIVEAENCPVGGDRPDDLFTRHWGRVVLEASRGPLIVHSIHTFADDPEVRMREIDELLVRVTEDLVGGSDVIVQGDLNHRPEDCEYLRWAKAGLTDSYALLNAKPDGGYTLLRPHPCRRLDYVFVGGGLRDRLEEARPLFEKDFRLYPERPDAVALSDHLPQLARFRD